MSCATPLRLRSLLLPLLALAALPAIRAQSEGPGRPATELSLRSRLISRSDLGAGGASVSQSSVGFAAEVPFPIAGGVNGKLGASLDLFELDFAAFDRTPPGIARPLSRGRVATLAPSLNFSPADKVFVFAGPQWELSAASGADTGGAVQWSGTVGAVWLFRPGLTLVGGFVFSERLGYSTRYLPIAGFNWQIDDTWSLALTGSAADYQAPVLKLAYALNPSTKLFAQVGFENGHLRLAGDSSIPHGYLRYEAFVPQVGADWRISPGVELSVFTGAQLNQKYDFKNQARQYVYRETADGAWVAGLRLNGRF